MNSTMNDLLNSIENLISIIKDKMVDWWWLEQGEYPLVKITIIGKDANNSISFKETPRISLIVALRKLRDNVQKLSDFDTKERINVLHRVSQDLLRIQRVVARIQDINSLLNEYSHLINISSLENAPMGIRKELFDLISNMREAIMKEEDETWRTILKNFRASLDKLSNKIAAPREKKLVVSEKKVEKKEEKEEVVMEA